LFSLIELFLLGGLAGLTIFLGLPLALVQRVSDRVKGLLNATAMGILVFLIVEVLSQAWGSTVTRVQSVISAGQSPLDAAPTLGAMFGGLAIGLIALVAYERRYLGTARGGDGVGGYKLATMIAAGIGAHNFSEGLAIGQSYASGAVDLALVLIIGFGAHNATEGFGIAAPLTNLGARPRVSFLVKAGLIGGGPTFVGTILGSAVFTPELYVFFLSLAGGALVYVTMMMYTAARRQATNDVLMIGALIGLIAGFATDLLVSIGGA
jgi:ZIP family zinc transporter